MLSDIRLETTENALTGAIRAGYGGHLEPRVPAGSSAHPATESTSKRYYHQLRLTREFTSRVRARELLVRGDGPSRGTHVLTYGRLRSSSMKKNRNRVSLAIERREQAR